MDNEELLKHCFNHFYGLDISNAAIHCAAPRYSPITFRLQEALAGTKFAKNSIAYMVVADHNGTYPEDPGR